MNSESVKVLIVMPNDEMRKTLMMMVSEYFKKDDIYMSENEQDALWQAADALPDIVIVSGNSLRLRAYGLLKRLHSCIPVFQGIIVYDSESDVYEHELKTLISHEHEYRGTIAVRIDQLCDELNRFKKAYMVT